jgi:hypothetical protein
MQPVAYKPTLARHLNAQSSAGFAPSEVAPRLAAVIPEKRKEILTGSSFLYFAIDIL